jgi:hypothetical protein
MAKKYVWSYGPAAAGGSNADGLLPILEIGSKPLVMR